MESLRAFAYFLPVGGGDGGDDGDDDDDNNKNDVLVVVVGEITTKLDKHHGEEIEMDLMVVVVVMIASQ